MTYSIDFRKKVLKIRKEERLSVAETAKRFFISLASVVRWSKNITPKEHRDKPATKLDMDALRKDIEIYPDAYQYERAERLGVTSQGVWHALKRLKVSYKKNPQASKGGSRKTLYLLPKNP